MEEQKEIRRFTIEPLQIADNETVVINGCTVTAVPHIPGERSHCVLCAVGSCMKGCCGMIRCSGKDRPGGLNIVLAPAGREAAAAQAMELADSIDGMEKALESSWKDHAGAKDVHAVEWPGAGRLCAWCIYDSEEGGCRRPCTVHGFYTTEELLPVAEALKAAYPRLKELRDEVFAAEETNGKPGMAEQKED